MHNGVVAVITFRLISVTISRILRNEGVADVVIMGYKAFDAHGAQERHG